MYVFPWKVTYNDCTTLQAKTDLNRQRITVVESYITIRIDRRWNYKLLSLDANNKQSLSGDHN